MVGQVENADGLAIAFRHRHAEIVLHPALGVVALFLADKGDRAAAEPRQARHHRLVLAEIAVAGQGREVLQEAAGIIQKMRTSGMARHLNLLPGGQPGIGVGHQGAGAALQPLDFGADIHVGVDLGELSQLDDFTLQLGNGALEFQIVHDSTR